MFGSSTQKHNWIFKDANEVAELRKRANHSYITSQNVSRNYLTYEEERTILSHYEYILKQFCGHFQPPITMPSVVGTSIAYFKRLYLNNSAMDFHPKEFYLVCVYLACKIEEFNVSITEFVSNIRTSSLEEHEYFTNMILNFELLLIEKLNFDLTIHNFYRPFEGFLLDLRTRCPDLVFNNFDMLRSYGLEFLDKTLNTDAILLYPPSQIALTAVIYSASKSKDSGVDQYCKNILFGDLNEDQMKQVLTIIKNINKMTNKIPVLNLDEIKRIEEKLNLCYDSEKYLKLAQANQRLLDDDDE